MLAEDFGTGETTERKTFQLKLQLFAEEFSHFVKSTVVSHACNIKTKANQRRKKKINKREREETAPTERQITDGSILHECASDAE